MIADERRARRELPATAVAAPPPVPAPPPARSVAAFPPDGLTPATPDEIRAFFAKR